jgi:hypothetical protein
VTSKHSYQNICTSQWLPYKVNFIIFLGILYWVCGRKQETENLFICIRCYNGQTKEDKMGVACRIWKRRGEERRGEERRGEERRGEERRGEEKRGEEIL